MYAQALGSILGLIICLYEYVYGDLILIGNKFNPETGYLSFICGYTLYPLCILLFLISLIITLLNKKTLLLKIEKINKYLTHITVIIGLLGCKYYFIIPALLILYRYYIPILLEYDLNRADVQLKKRNKIIKLLKNNFGKHTIVKLFNVSYEEVEILELLYCHKRKM